MQGFGIRTAVALGATLGVALSFAVGVANAAVGDIIERRVPGTTTGGLNRVTTGPDGNIWFTDGGNNQIGRMTPAGVFTGFNLPTPNSGPVDITTGPDGALWFTEFEGKIGRITTSGQITEFPLLLSPGVNRHPLGITNGPDGALWFITDCCDPAPGNNGKVGRITTAGAITLFSVQPGTAPAPGITTGLDGNLWYSASASPSDGRIQRMSPTGVVNGDFPIPTPFSDPSRLVVGPDGNIWFTEQGAVGANGSRQPTSPSPGKIGRISPNGQIAEFTTPGQNFPSRVSNPAGITVGADGNLWFTEYSYLTVDTMVQHGGNMIGRITTSGQITEYPIPTQFSRADGIAAGPAGDGGVYFTQSPANFAFGAIGRIQVTEPAAAPVANPSPPAVQAPIATAPLRKVNVAGFTARVLRSRDRRAPYRFTVSGRVRLPAKVGNSACSGGRVSVQTRVGARSISTKRATLRSNCTYQLTVTFANRRNLGSGRLTLRVRFLGTARLNAAGPRNLSARAG